MTVRDTFTNTLNKALQRYTFFFLVFIVQYSFVKLLQLDSLSSTLTTHWQFLDLSYLESDSVSAILLDHAQPPFLNLVVWLLLKMPYDLYQSFIVFNCICMSSVSFIIYRILIQRTSLKFARYFSFFYAVFPSVILNISYPFYPCLVALGYSLIAYSFHLVRIRATHSIIFFCLSILVVSFTRQSFTIFHILLSCVWFYYISKNEFREAKINVKAVLAGLFFLTLLLPVKNLYYYGFFGSSSWLPQTISSGWKIDTPLGPFPSPSKIIDTYPAIKCPRTHTNPDLRIEKTNGDPNFHSCLVIEYSEIVLKNGLNGYSPAKHLKSIVDYIGEYFSLPDEYMFLTNREKIRIYAEFMEIPQLAITYKLFTQGSTHELRLILIIPPILLLTYFRKRSDNLTNSLIFVVVIHFLTYTFSEGAESSRFVFEVESFFILMLGLCLFEMISLRKRHEQAVLGKII